MNYSRGSIWRKWDLHVHTPASIVNQYTGANENEKWDKFLADIEGLPSEFKVLGINDYLFLDGYEKLKKEKEENGRLQNINLLLPIVEFRISKFAGVDFGKLKRINLHVIFSNELSVETIKSQFLNTLQQSYKLSPDFDSSTWNAVITRESLADLGKKIKETIPKEKLSDYASDIVEGFNNLNLNESQLFESLKNHYFKDKYLVGIGKTEWDQLRWSDVSISEKKNIINQADIIFTASETPENWKKAKAKLKEQHVKDLLLDCSDAHSLSNSAYKDKIGNCFTWIKADPTFEGLKMILRESERAFIGKEPPLLQRVRNNKTKYISSLEFQKVDDSSLDEVWFSENDSMAINHGLVAIIGKKGSGKSALVDSLGLLSDTRQNRYFSFLNENKFRLKKGNKAKHFEAILKWESGALIKKNLNDIIDEDNVEMTKYIPQNYLETVCSEEIEGGRFNNALKATIFSHVSESQQLGYTTLDDLITYKTSEKSRAVKIIQEELHNINLEIISLEEKLHPDYQKSVRKKLELKEKERTAHEGTKPHEVKKPAIDSKQTKELQTLTQDILVKEEELKKLEKEVKSLEAKKKQQFKRFTNAGLLLEKLDNFIKQYTLFKEECEEIAKMLSIDIDDIVKIEIQKESIEKIETDSSNKVNEISRTLKSSNKEGPVFKKEQLNKEIEVLRNKLDQPNKEYQVYLKEMKEWETTLNEIEGDESTPDTIKYYENQLRDIKSIPRILEKKKIHRTKKVKEIYEQLNQLKEAYSHLYQPVKDFVDFHDSVRERFSIDFRVSVVCEGFLEKFFEYINQNKKGSFYGIDDGRRRLKDVLDSADFDDESGLLHFLSQIEEYLSKDIRDDYVGKDDIRFVSDQIKQDVKVIGLYDFLYSMNYLKTKYVLQWDGKDLSELSPGERGTVLLIFYLFIAKDELPLLMDQPEENLDNETVYKIIVPCIKEAKKRRQIIIVTHNPNLAVVCDAEQIIHCEMEKHNKNRITYTCGAIENPQINKALIDVLEGTRPAFENRDDKYYV
ncbi:MAG TPA: hypothetical protein VMW72_01825 [Sedimentisphaerales bacterium]|nr:hypothetical protein [Sedimentisphaerales bacterium]